MLACARQQLRITLAHLANLRYPAQEADTALRLARYFGTTPQFWMNLQRNDDLRRAEAEVGARIREEIEARPEVAA
jgi:addiction module HigA family antidote